MKTTFISIILIGALLAPIALHAQSYGWPTNASRALSSTFAEFRPGHLHSGLDIKTWNREGYKVYAVADGYILRVKTSPFGYGKMIYQRLTDGNIAVYAHLARFSPVIEKIVRDLQQETKAYRVDKMFEAGEIQIKKGEVIAYTGKTGTKEPHLHFEIRDNENNPMNPLAFGLKIKDNLPPVPARLALIPLKAASEVNGGYAAENYTLTRSHRNIYALRDTIQLYGEVGFALSTYDRANGVPNKYGINALSLKIDGAQYFRANYETFSFDDARQVEVDREYSFWRKGVGLYYSLYHKQYNTLPFYSHIRGGKVVPSIGEGLHNFSIRVSDYFGNSALVEGVFVYQPARDLTLSVERLPLSELLLHCSIDGAEVSRVVLDGMDRNTGEYVRLQPREVAVDSTGWSGTVYAGDRDYSYLRAVGFDERGIPTRTAWHSIGPRQPVFGTLSFDIYPGFTVVFFRSEGVMDIPPAISLVKRGGEELPLSVARRTGGEFQACFPNEMLEHAVALRAYTSGGTRLYDELPLTYERIPAASGGILASTDGNMVAEFAENSLYYDYYGTVKIEPEGELQKNPVTPLYTISPTDQPMKHAVTVLMRYPEKADPEKVGVYYLDPKKGWIFLRSENDTSLNVLSTKVLSMETFAALVDNELPTIELLSPRKGVKTAAEKFIVSAKVGDELSGIRDELAITIEIDSVPVIFEYHPVSKTVTYKPYEPLSSGGHTLRLTAKDNVGNSTEITTPFIIR